VEAPLICKVDHFSAAKMRAQFCNRHLQKSLLYQSDSGPAGYPTECGVAGRMERQALK
jgi:hypothetical protein